MGFNQPWEFIMTACFYGKKGGLKEGLELARLFSKSLSPWSLSTLIQNLVGLHCMEKKEGRKGELLSTCLPPK
jgi:hypothetical protein